jgi:RHS repeat-associated protein
VTGITHKQGQTVLGNLTYEYDKAGNRTKIGGSFARTGIPQSVSSTNYNAANHQTTFGDKTLTYDNNGNLTSIADASETTLYTWNARNQLTGISGPNVSASFVYDGLGRREKRTINGNLTEFLHDGINPVQETSGATVLANILTGLDIDEYFARSDASGNSFFFPDDLGSSVALTDSAGVVQTEYTYEPFGRTTVTGAASFNPLQYTGRENDGTGLYYYRARYYHPALQRFMSEGPIEFGGGDINLYAYVRNSPTNTIDPTGLKLDLSKAGNRLKDALEKVKGTKRGKELYDKLDQSKDTYKIKEYQPGDPCRACYIPRTKEIIVDPSFNPKIETTMGRTPASSERILGHEMGHAATGACDCGIEPGVNAILNENPVATELGQPPRTKY